MAHKIPSIYEKSFVGIWKRKFRSGRPDQDIKLLIFNSRGGVSGPIGPGSRVGSGKVVKIDPDENAKGTGVITINSGGQDIHWNYTLNRNNDFKADFHPIGPNRTAPVLNELLLVGQGARHLYAFLSHPYHPRVTEKEVLAKLKV